MGSCIGRLVPRSQRQRQAVCAVVVLVLVLVLVVGQRLRRFVAVWTCRHRRLLQRTCRIRRRMRARLHSAFVVHGRINKLQLAAARRPE